MNKSRVYMKKIKVTLLTIGTCVLMAIPALAYNGKFSFSLTSGTFSPTKYSSYAYKVSSDQAPVVTSTYRNNSYKVTYSVVNSDGQDRVKPITKKHKFVLTAFENNFAQQNHKYKLPVKRASGSWDKSTRTDGLWNIDSY